MYATKVLRITLSALHLFLSSVKFWVSLVAITKKRSYFQSTIYTMILNYIEIFINHKNYI